MKKVVIDEGNRDYVNGMLKKFFEHKDFISWHSFNCGMKKRIPHEILIPDTLKELGTDMVKHDTRVVYTNVRPRISDKTFVVDLSSCEHFVFTPGVEVMFLGNRIITKKPWVACGVCDEKYVYGCFQIMSSNDNTDGFRKATFDEDDDEWDDTWN